jgi:Kef-type K+ transport system membrane component KefB/mannitol/fructose-specific phosphotransferase system IIA component (Ntr-type)
MQSLSHQEVTVLFLSLGILLASARFLGEIARSFQQPAVLGEIIAGIILGPTVLGTLLPDCHAFLFPAEGGVKIALDGLVTVAIALFLMVAGMEVDLSMAWRQGKAALIVGFLGIIIPFALGFTCAWFFNGHLGRAGEQDSLVFSLFFATAMSISALPVIARILMDLNLYRTDLGMVIVSAAILNDIAGWNIFGLVLGMIDSDMGSSHNTPLTIFLTIAFTGAMLTVGRWLFNRALPWFQAHTSWPGGVLGFVLTASFLSAAATEWIGVHAIFGAFMCGVAVGDSPHMRQRTRTTIEQFVSFIFAPIFFASIGLRVNFIANFDLTLVVAVLIIATVGKVIGCSLGAMWCGLPNREALAVGVGMNARGAMEIILGLLALQRGLIDERVFVALVVMALVTSLTSGSLIQRILARKLPAKFTDFLSSSRFQLKVSALTREEVVRELAGLAAKGTGLDAQKVGDQVWEREQVMSTGLEKGLAIPHARLEGLKAPVLAVGLSQTGVDFDSFDGQPTQLIFLILTPIKDNGAQLEILADISRTFHDPALVVSATQANSYTEFLALVKSQGPETG